MINSSATNVPNILDKKRKSVNTIRNIMKMVTGLGNQTFEGGLIYCNSLLRGSLLNAAETYVNLLENEKLKMTVFCSFLNQEDTVNKVWYTCI